MRNREYYVPKKAKKGKSNYLCIAAHQDDVEIMAADGAVKADNGDASFYACIVTNGSGSARSGKYEKYTDTEMMQVRRDEQIKAAEIGGYAGLYLLDFPCAINKDPHGTEVEQDLLKVLSETKPEVVYTHNLCDKHDTHIGVVTKAIKAIRMMPMADRPKKVYGCECWRGLDWMNDEQKIVFDLSGKESLRTALVNVFESQIAGGKRYDLATEGRRLANATFFQSHNVDAMDSIGYAMDLTPLILDDKLDIIKYIVTFLDDFKNDVKARIDKML